VGSLAPLGVRTFLSRPLPASRWRRRAREVIAAVLENHHDTPRDALLNLVDGAYPFGERAHHPYKAWLAERRQLVEDLQAAPTVEEWEVIQVASGLVEEGRLDEARAMLDEHAPNRHARGCIVCGRGAGKPCREPKAATFKFVHQVDSLGHSASSIEFTDRLIPHAARVQP